MPASLFDFMPEKISIVIATYGSDEWKNLALNRARPSCINQGADEIVVYHDPAGNLADSRNHAILSSRGDWILCVDADDELEPGYVDIMRKTSGDLRYPLVRYVTGNEKVLPNPTYLPEKSMVSGNHLVIGTLFPRKLFLKVGGFSPWAAWEDFAMFLRMVYVGAIRKPALPAIYRAYKNPNGGRNAVKNPQELFHEILREFRHWALKYDGGAAKVRDFWEFFGKGR